MRYELYLTKLPKLEPNDIKARFADVPPGLSAGVLKKALEDKKVPSIAIAWSENRNALFKIRDRLGTLGGASRFVDNAPLVVKIFSSIVEGAERAVESVIGAVGLASSAAAKASQAKLKPKPAKKSKAGPFGERGMVIFGAALGLLIKITIAVGLYAAYATSLAQAGAGSVTLLLPQLIAVTVGVLCVHVMSVSVTAVLAQRLTVVVAGPMVVVPLAVVVFAFVNLDTPEYQKVERVETKPVVAAAVQAPLPPAPSRPYQGLMEELRIRKLKASERVLNEVRDNAAPGELPAGVAAATPGKLSEKKTTVQGSHGGAATQTTTPGAPAATPPAATTATSVPAAPATVVTPAAPVAPAGTPVAKAPSPPAKPVVPAKPKVVAKRPPPPPPPFPYNLLALDPWLLAACASGLWLILCTIAFLVARKRIAKRFGKQAAAQKREHEDALEIAAEQASTLQRDEAARLEREHEEQLEAAKAELRDTHREELERLQYELAEERAARALLENAAKQRQSEETRKPAAAAARPFNPNPVVSDKTRVLPPAAAEKRAHASERPAAKAADKPAAPRSSYAVFNVEEERISIPTRDKR